MDTSDTPAPATGPVKRTLASTVASLAVLLDLLGSVVADIESSAPPRIKGLMLVRSGTLRESSATVRARRRTAESAQEVRDGLLDGITLAETTIAQLRMALAPPAVARIARFAATPVRWMWRPARHFTYADFYQQSEQVLDGLKASRQWIVATPLRRRVKLVRVVAEVQPAAQPDAVALAPSPTPTPAPEEVPFVVTRLPAGTIESATIESATIESATIESATIESATIEFGSRAREESEELAGTTPTRWTIHDLPGYGMAAMMAQVPAPISPIPASSNPNAARQPHGERGMERWTMPNAEAPAQPAAPPADPAANPGIA